MADAMHVKTFVRAALDVLSNRTAQETEVDEALSDHGDGHVVDVVAESRARLAALDAAQLRGEDDFVNGPLLGREPARYRPRARQVAAAIVDLGPRVDQDEIAIPDAVAVRRIMQHGRVAAAGDNRWVRSALSAAAGKDVFDDRLDFVFEHSGPAMLHRGEMALS